MCVRRVCEQPDYSIVLSTMEIVRWFENFILTGDSANAEAKAKLCKTNSEVYPPFPSLSSTSTSGPSQLTLVFKTDENIEDRGFMGELFLG